MKTYAWSLLAAGAVFAISNMAHAQIGMTKLVSRSSSGALANGNATSAWIAADGRFLVFDSVADNLVPGVPPGVYQIYLHDGIEGTTKCVSVDSLGNPGLGESFFGSISGDGRCVSFGSLAQNLVPGVVSANDQIYVHDALTGETTCVSLDPTGQPADGACYFSRISGDGRYVVFGSYAANLVPGDTNGVYDIFQHDRVTGRTVRVHVDSSGNEANGDAGEIPSLSPDGRFVVFSSWATNLVTDDTNDQLDMFVHDTTSGETTRVSVDSSGGEANGSSNYGWISADGRFVAFDGNSDNLVPDDTNGEYDVFLHDRVTGETTRISVDSAGNQGSGSSSYPHISHDGRYVAFTSWAPDLVPGDTNDASDVFVHDRATGETTRISISSQGAQGNANSEWPALSADGRWVSFTSSADNLVEGDTTSAAFLSDCFVRDRLGLSPTVATYCTAGTTSNGCVPAISGAGVPSATAGSGFIVTARAVDGRRKGLLIYGVSGPAAVPWNGGASSSFLCIAQPIRRIAAQDSGGTAGACDGVLRVDWNDFVATNPSGLGTPFDGGETVWMQGWFRDKAAPGGSHLTDALWFEICP